MTAVNLLRILRPVAITVLALALYGCGREPQAERSATDGRSLATVVADAGTAPDELVLDGIVEPVHQATLSAQTSGRVASVLVDVDDAVTEGQVLLRLRATEEVAGLGQAEAALTAARARETQAGAQFDRIRDMYERKVVARATYDEALAARDAAAASLAAARFMLESAREGVAYTELRAPYDGTVTEKRAQAGEAVAPGTPLLTIASLDALRVVVEVPQSVAGSVRTSGQAQVHLGGGRIVAGKVTLFPSAEPTSSTVRARVDLPAAAAGIAPGMHAKVGFVTGESSRVRVPRAAVVERSELRAVYVVGPDGRVALRQVRLGHASGGQVEVIAGLTAGERVATDPAAAGLRANAAATATHE